MSLWLSLPLTELLVADRKCHTCRLKICLHRCPTQLCISRKAEQLWAAMAVWADGCGVLWCEVGVEPLLTITTHNAMLRPCPHPRLAVACSWLVHLFFLKTQCWACQLSTSPPLWQPVFPLKQGTSVWFVGHALQCRFSYTKWRVETSFYCCHVNQGMWERVTTESHFRLEQAQSASECPQYLVH